MASLSFEFEMKDFIPTCVREGGLRDKPMEEGVVSLDLDLKAYLLTWG
jgi:hypothetical protein